MYTIRNILISAIKNEIILFATEYIASIFPNAVYHIVSVIPRYSRKRSMFTKLVDEALDKIAREAVDEVEFVLTSRGIHYIKKTILKGDPIKALTKYAETYNIDVIVTSSASCPTPPPKLVGSTASKIIARIDKPVFIATPYSFENREELLKNGLSEISIVCMDIDRIGKALDLAYYISRIHGSRLNMLFSKKIPSNKINELQHRLSQLRVKMSISVIKHENLDDFVEKALEETSKSKLLIITRQHRVYEKILFPFIKHHLTRYERLFMGLSKTPLFIV